MNPDLVGLYNSAAAERLSLHNADTMLAVARQRDTAQHGLKVIEGVVAKELLVSDDAAEFGRTNAAIRVPTTLDHPGIPATK